MKKRLKEGREKLSQQIADLIMLNRIQTWALEEARRRLEKEGILEDPFPESSSASVSSSVASVVGSVVGKE